MVALQILDIRDFMNKLLCSETFDNFLLQEAFISGCVNYHIEGSLNREFYSQEELETDSLSDTGFIPFGKIRTQCFHLIKGKHTPLQFKFVFLLSPSNLKKTLLQTHSVFTETDISAMFLNLKYQNGTLMATTGISYRIFTADKGLDHEWDALVTRFFKNHMISFEKV